MRGKKTSNRNDPLVSIVVLNWNGADDTIACLSSINELIYKNYEVIVVDNGSKEEDVRKLEDTQSTAFTLVRNKKNLGFAGGEVSALSYCHGEYVLLLNNDARIDKHALGCALDSFASDPRVAAVGGRSYSLSEEGEATHGFYSYQYIDPVTAEVSTYRTDQGAHRALEVVTVSGSCVMLKRAVIDKMGYFDERFFAYYEETDLFARFLRGGYKIIYNPDVIIQHKDGASTKDKRYMYNYLMLKNQFLFAYKNYSRPYLRSFKKTFWRNFRRSLWVYVKDRSRAEVVHKARVRSAIWNVVHLPRTFLSRRQNISINPTFDYSDHLVSHQPLPTTLVLDVRNIAKTTRKALDRYIVSLESLVKELIFITDSHSSRASSDHRTSVRDIVDNGRNDTTAYEYGFMCSNTNYVLFLDPASLLKQDTLSLVQQLSLLVRDASTNESALFVASKRMRSDFDLKNRVNSILGFRKDTLVSYLTGHDTVYELTAHSLSYYLAWALMDCQSFSYIQPLRYLAHLSLSVESGDHRALHSRTLWTIKKVLKSAHLLRLIALVKKRLIPRSLHNTPHSTSPSATELATAVPLGDLPIFINTRDRLEPLTKLVTWLEKSGNTNIIFVDNVSTYPPLMNYFKMTRHQVIPLGRNGMHKAPWESFAIRFIAKDGYYVVSDPDIIPTKTTPLNTIDTLYTYLQKYSKPQKAGVALRIDDIPSHYSMRQHVIDWESRFWDKTILLEPGVYAADVDTTFALYRPRTWWFLAPSIRVANGYEMQHEPWYQNLEDPTEDMLYYRARASSEVSTWTKGRLPKHHLRALKKEGLL